MIAKGDVKWESRRPFDHWALQMGWFGKFYPEGLQASWYFGQGFSLNSTIGGAIFYGFVKAHNRAVMSSSTTDSGEAFTDIQTYRDHEWVTRSNIDLLLALQWEHCFSAHLLAFDFAWEYHNFFDQNFFRMATSSADSARGNLAYNGFTFGMAFSF